MRKKILGTDLKVSAIGLGCMGMNHAYGASADKTEMINLIAQAVDIVCPVTAIQNRYSMMARWHEKLFPVLEELNIGFVAFSPLANAFNAQSDPGVVVKFFSASPQSMRSILPADV